MLRGRLGEIKEQGGERGGGREMQIEILARGVPRTLPFTGSD